MAKCSGSSLVGANAASTGEPSNRWTPISSGVTASSSTPLGETATRSPARSDTLPAVPMTRRSRRSARQASATAARSVPSSILLTFRKVVAVLDGRLHFDAINPDGPTHRYAGSVLVAGERGCLLYTSDAADEEDSVDLGG